MAMKNLHGGARMIIMRTYAALTGSDWLTWGCCVILATAPQQERGRDSHTYDRGSHDHAGYHNVCTVACARVPTPADSQNHHAVAVPVYP
jgi:hypothetical protein